MSASSAASHHRILSLYRSLLRQIYFEPNEVRQYRLRKQLREEAEKLRLSSQEEILARGEKKLAFLKSVTPKIKPKKQELQDTVNMVGDEATKVFVMRDGKLVDVKAEIQDNNQSQPSSKPMSNWTGNNIDPDAYARHMRLMRRMQFQEGPLKDYPTKVHGMPHGSY